MNEPIGDIMMSDEWKQYVAGADSGGTKTILAVRSLATGATRREKFGSLNINGTTEEKVRRTVGEMIRWLQSLPNGLPGCEALCLGVAGVTNSSLGELLDGLIRGHGYGGPLSIVGDHHIALRGALSDQPGVLLIAGTGSVCVGQNGERLVQAGGWGHIIGDEGSGYAIGRDILAAVACDVDGMQPTVLRNLLFGELGIGSRREMIDFTYQNARDKRDIAKLSVLLETALARGDAVARCILAKNARALARLAHCVVQALAISDAKVVYSGGLLTSCESMAKKTTEYLFRMLPSAMVCEALHDATDGALQIAERMRNK